MDVTGRASDAEQRDEEGRRKKEEAKRAGFALFLPLSLPLSLSLAFSLPGAIFRSRSTIVQSITTITIRSVLQMERAVDDQDC